MVKKNSVFKTILFNNILIMTIPLTLVFSVACYLVCVRYKNDVQQTSYNFVYEYTSEVKSEIEKTLQISEYILKNPNIIQGLDSSFQTAYDRLDFSMEVKSYIDSVSNENTSHIVIYTPNLTVFSTTYLMNSDKLEGYHELLRRLAKSETNVIWDDAIREDERGRQYIAFYREFLMRPGSVLSSRLYFPARPPYMGKISVLQPYAVPEETSFVTEVLDDIAVIAYPIDARDIVRHYLLYILFFLALDGLVIVAVSVITKKMTQKVTGSIVSFVEQLSEEDARGTDISMDTLPINEEDAEELKVIKKTINKLLKKIHSLYSVYYQSELDKKQLELSLFQSKIEPHILYNSLSVIKLNVYEHRDEDTIKMLNNLVGYYRAVLNYGKELNTIEQELEMLKKYVAIYELAHRKKYEFVIDIDETVRQKEILHLLIQPFLENAIIHGLSGTKENGVIRLSCSYEDGCLSLCLSDNGYGMSPDLVEKLNCLDSYEGHYGIKNSYQRLKLFYGNESKIMFDSEQNKGTTVTLCFRA